MTRKDAIIAGIRRGPGDVENALVDDLLAGRIDRRVFLRHATRLGFGFGTGILPLFRGLATARGMRDDLNRASSPQPALPLGTVDKPFPGGRAGATITVAVAMPHGAIDPVLVNETERAIRSRTGYNNSIASHGKIHELRLFHQDQSSQAAAQGQARQALE